MNAAKAVLAKRHRDRTKHKAGLSVLECRVCQNPLPSTLEHDHHEVPQAAGGQEGPLKSLCANCHGAVHQIAVMLLGGRASLAEDTAKIAYPDPKARERVFALANVVVEWMTLKRDGKLENNEPLNVLIELTPPIKLAAQFIANDMRGPTGRRLGLSTWISGLVKREVYARYPHLKTKGSP